MSKRLVPKLRFKEFDHEWITTRLKTVVKRITRKNQNMESNLPLTISAQHGLVNQKDFFTKQVTSKNVSNYYLLERGDFAYNKSYSNQSPWGAVKRLDLYPKGVLSTLYIVFKPTNVNSSFLVYYYDTSVWHKEISRYAQEGARQHGLLNIAVSDFFNSKLNIADDKIEQQKIGQFFSKLDQLIDLQSQKLSHLKQLKKGYLQKMFPQKGESVPRLRFNMFHDLWHENKLNSFLSIPKKEKANVNKLTDIMSLKLHLKGITNHSNRDTLSLNSTNYYIRHSGQLLYGKQNFFYGSIGIIPKQFEGLVTSSDVPALNINYINTNYLYMYISRSDFFKRSKILATGTGSKRLHEKDLMDMNIFVPKNNEQERIGIFFKNINQLIKQQENKFSRIKKLKKAYLQKMFV